MWVALESSIECDPAVQKVSDSGPDLEAAWIWFDQVPEGFTRGRAAFLTSSRICQVPAVSCENI